MNLHLIHTDVYGPSLGRVKVKVKGRVCQGLKMAFFSPFGGLRVVCVW